MKKLLVGVSVLIVLVLAAGIAGDHYRYELYETAINMEAGKADLSNSAAMLSRGEIHYLANPRKDGQETIIMLHGFSANKTNWLRFAQQLNEQYHLVIPDLLGHGENATPLERSYRISEQVEMIKELARSLEIERFHLVGNSMGGAITSLYSATYPDDVLTATLISPAGVHDIASVMDELLKQDKNPLIPASYEEFEAVLDFVMEEKPFIPAPIAKVEAEKSVARVEINKKIFSDLQADLKAGMEARLESVQAPVLIIWGDHDRAINVDNIDKYAQLIPKAEKLVYENIGHLAMVEVPKRSATDMMNFISRH